MESKEQVLTLQLKVKPRRMRVRQAAGDLFWKRSGEPERSVDSRRQLPDADDFPAFAAGLAQRRLLPSIRFFRQRARG
jgi:hypothetical protein